LGNLVLADEENIIVSTCSSTFFGIFEKESKLPYQVRCMLLSAFLYVPGLVLAFSQGNDVFREFIVDFGFLAACLTAGLTLWSLISFFRKSGTTIKYLNRFVFQTDGYDKFVGFLNSPSEKRKGTLWYYTESIGGGMIAFFLAYTKKVGAWWFFNPHTGLSSSCMHARDCPPQSPSVCLRIKVIEWSGRVRKLPERWSRRLQAVFLCPGQPASILSVSE